MSVLNQLFNRGNLGPRCKTCLNLAISRIKLLQNRRDGQLKQMRKEIAQFLQTGQEAIARIRVEHVIREQNVWAAYEVLEMFCEFVLARVPILESQKECPPELREAIASIIFAAPRCSDLPDLLQVKNLFTAKYGKEFVSAVSELRPDTSVNRTIIEKLSVSAPSAQVKLKLLIEIAQEYRVNWDPSETEVEFNKKHDDLLDGLKHGAVISASPSPQQSHDSPSSEAQSLTPQTPTGQSNIRGLPSSVPTGDKPQLNSNIQGLPSSGPTSNRPLLNSNGTGASSRNSNKGESASDNCSNILEKARAAIASAERASAAARAAAQLVNVNFGSLKLQEGTS